MRFEWNDAKNRANIRKHGIDFQDAVDIFNHPLLCRIDQRADYGEERWVALGQIQFITGVVVYTERVDDTIRIISARKATKQEARRYEETISY